MELNSPVIRNATRAVARAVARRKEAICKTIAECSHVQVGECEHLPSRTTFGSPTPPARICLNCGITEDGWHCGYLILKNPLVIPVTRDDVYALRTVHFHADDQGPLLRHELSVLDMVRDKLGLREEPKPRPSLKLV
jgi:hypothetical protein